MAPPSHRSPKDSMQVISQHGQTCWTPTVCEALHLVGHNVWGPGPNLEGASVRKQRGSEITTKADFVFKEYEIEMGWEHLHRKNCNKRPHEWHKMSASYEDLRPWQTGFTRRITQINWKCLPQWEGFWDCKGLSRKVLCSIRNVCQGTRRSTFP